MKVNSHILRQIVTKNFTWEMLDKRYTNVEMLKTNVHCRFHEHSWTEGNSKFYYNEDKGIWVMYCFVEKKAFDTYDFLTKVLIEQKQLYTSPLDFLRQHMPEGEILSQYKIFEKNEAEFVETSFAKKKEYIDNCYNETGNIIGYIQLLYTEEY